MRGRLRSAGVGVSLLLVAGCGTESSSSDLSEDLSFVPSGGMLGFSDRAAIREIAGSDADDPWTVAAGAVAGSFGSYEQYLADELSVDLSAADRVFQGGEGPNITLVIVGGQDADAVNAAARAAGWSGDEVLTRESEDASRPPLPLGDLRVTEDRVIIGGPTARLGSEGGVADSAGEDETTAALIECLGDPLAALVAPPSETPHAVGVRENDGTTESSICLVGDEDDGERVAEGLGGTAMNGRPYSDLIADPEVRTVGDTVRVTVTNTADALPVTIMQMMLVRDLPGLG